MTRPLARAATLAVAAFSCLFCLLPAAAQAQAATRSAQVELGARLYATHCSLCHGADGKRGAAFQTPIWGGGALIARFGHGQGLFEYLQLLMPFDDPSKLSDEQKWAVTAFMLVSHGALPAQQTLGPGNAKGIAIK